jgi:hypothetical protein
MKTITGLSIAVALTAAFLIANALAQGSSPRPEGVSENEWISISKNFGVVLAERPSTAKEKRSTPARGQFMVLSGGKWFPVEPILQNRIDRVAQ